MAQWIDIDSAHGRVAAWHAWPETTPRAAVIVIQEIFGANPHIRQVAEDFAAQGYEVVAPAFFDLVEKNVQLPYDADGVRRGRELVDELGVDRAVDLVRAAAQALTPTAQSPRCVGTVGYCWGGTIALLAATRLGLPSVSYYGARNVQFLDETPKAPLMFHFGERDRSIPAQAVQQHREKLPQMPVFSYPADHAFNRDVGDGYDPDSARLARDRTLRFFAEHLT